MGRLTNVIRVAWRFSYANTNMGYYLPQRGCTTNFKFDSGLKWVKPEKKKWYHPENTGDLAPMIYPKTDELTLSFKESKELATANEDVKKVFSLKYQLPSESYFVYQNELVEKVRRHPLDTHSVEVQIAKLTAKIRYMQGWIENSKDKQLRTKLNLAINKRKKCLRLLRKWDYRNFEWILETLDLEYRPLIRVADPVTRKKSLVLLARLQMEKEKEEKVAKLKQSLDEKKVPFLEKKLETLKWIQQEEKKNGLESTVTDKDIEECLERLERVKLEVAERQKRGYVRKVHPVTLEVYDENLLIEKESAASKS